MGIDQDDIGLVFARYFSVDDPFVESLAVLHPHSRLALDHSLLIGRKIIGVTVDRKTGDLILIDPQTSGDESMNTSVFWDIRNGKEKLKSAYMDLEEKPELAKRIKEIVRELNEIEKQIDPKGY